MKLGISQIPGGRKLFSNMTVGDNLEMGAYASTAGKEKKETLEQVYQIFPVLKERRKQSAN
ncbi:MAG: branched-chain amino acid ABC transporter ATP-binding protein, partial [Phycisphaerae bacterium]|nr:branched-chain amino acid ABC transporter ATP-binding protein [Gammaproteobacteria bacterium]NIU55219.1 branched-chain amino acid ABC transporter ATP-binding protein [Phycisphaerae bacterium]NIW91670.1 branched-chain amino acid ABC transporter ATP-binding protein [Phycisphaerae bacterium]